MRLSLLLPAVLLALSAPAAIAQQPANPLTARVAAFKQATPDGRLAAVKSELEAAKLAYQVEEFAGRRAPPAKGFNVTARIGPAEGREIVLVAHYDALALPNGKLVDGLVDNAASVVAMVEAMKQLQGKTKHPIRLLLTDQEELGLVGARAFIASHGVTNIAAVINADVNGYGDTLMYGLNNGPQSAGMITAMKDVCSEKKFSCLDFPQYPPSDDRAFTAAGAPTISIGFQPKAEAEKLRAFMQNPSPGSQPPEVLQIIHTTGDNISRVEPTTITKAAEAFTALALKLDATLP